MSDLYSAVAFSSTQAERSCIAAVLAAIFARLVAAVLDAIPARLVAAVLDAIPARLVGRARIRFIDRAVAVMSDDELLDFLPQQHADFDLDAFSAAPTAAPGPLPAFAPAVSCLDAFHLATRLTLGGTAMPLNLPTGRSVGNSLPYLRYAAQTGQWFTRDNEIDPTGVWDLGDVITGWMYIETGSSPIYNWDLAGEAAKRPGRGHKRGFSVRALIGGVVYELNASGSGLVKAMVMLYAEYEAAPEAARGLMPTVSDVDHVEHDGGSYGKFYDPVLHIISWNSPSAELLKARATPRPNGSAVPVHGSAAPVAKTSSQSQGGTLGLPNPSGANDDNLDDEIPF